MENYEYLKRMCKKNINELIEVEIESLKKINDYLVERLKYAYPYETFIVVRKWEEK